MSQTCFLLVSLPSIQREQRGTSAKWGEEEEEGEGEKEEELEEKEKKRSDFWERETKGQKRKEDSQREWLMWLFPQKGLEADSVPKGFESWAAVPSQLLSLKSLRHQP